MDSNLITTCIDVPETAIEVEERLKFIRAKRDLVELRNPQPSHLVRIEIAEYNLEEAELQIQLRLLSEPTEPSSTVNAETSQHHTSPSGLNDYPDISCDSHKWTGVEAFAVEGTAEDANYFTTDGFLGEIDLGQMLLDAEPHGFEELINFECDDNESPSINNSYDGQDRSNAYVRSMHVAPESYSIAAASPYLAMPTTLLPYLGAVNQQCNRQTQSNLVMDDSPGLANVLKQNKLPMDDGSRQTSTSVSSCPDEMFDCQEASIGSADEMTQSGSNDPQISCGSSTRPETKFPISMVPVKEANIPGTSCFRYRPQEKHTRRQPTKEEQLAINTLRRKGACLLCRVKNAKCSEDDPCKNCQDQVPRWNCKENLRISPVCLRSFSDVDPFSYLQRGSLCHLRTSLPDFNKYATGRPAGHSTTAAMGCLSMIDIIRERTGFLARIEPANKASWTTYASGILQALDFFMSKKRFWQQKPSAMILVAASDLLMSLCLDLALHVRHTINAETASHSTADMEQLTHRLVFCVQRIMSFRRLIMPRLNVPSTLFLEESTLNLLRTCSLDFATVRQYVSVLEGQSIYFEDEEGSSSSSKELLLLQATRLGSIDLMEEALAAGAQPDLARDHILCRTALCEAAHKGNRTGVERLVLAGANTIIRDKFGLDAFDMVGLRRYWSLKTYLEMSALMQAAAKLNISLEAQHTIERYLVHTARRPRQQSDTRQEAIRQMVSTQDWPLGSKRGILKLLDLAEAYVYKPDPPKPPKAKRNAGTDPGQSIGQDPTPLHLACKQLRWTDGLSLVRSLCNAGADVHCVDRELRTPLHLACSNFCTSTETSRELCQEVELKSTNLPRFLSYVDVLHSLLRRGADPNAKDVDGRTPLHYALEPSCPYHGTPVESFVDVVETLLRSGADITIRCQDSLTPLQYGIRLSILRDSMTWYDSHAVRLLLRREVDPETVACCQKLLSYPPRTRVKVSWEDWLPAWANDQRSLVVSRKWLLKSGLRRKKK